MKVLMITPQVDLYARKGFIVTWIRKLAERVDKLFVITLNYDGETMLPQNVTVYGLDKKSNKISKYFYLNKILINLVATRGINIIFCHMHAEFTIWATPWAQIFKVPVIQWYAHGTVSWQLKFAHFLASKVVTPSTESFGIKSNKVIVTGHGIDTGRFKPAVNLQRKKDKLLILSVGRISPRKNLETLIKAADIWVNEKGMKDLEFIIVGGVPMASQEEYFEKLKNMVRELRLGDYVKFVGAVPYSAVVGYYQNCDIHVNLCPTGGVDKAVLEAMACEKPVIVCNETFEDVFGDHSGILMFGKENSTDLAMKIMYIIQLDKLSRNELCRAMRQIVEKKHNVESLMDKLINVFENSRR